MISIQRDMFPELKQGKRYWRCIHLGTDKVYFITTDGDIPKDSDRINIEEINEAQYMRGKNGRN